MPNTRELFGIYDVAVVGAGFTGVITSIAAARAGARTIVLEGSGVLGGLVTGGRLTKPTGLVNGGIFRELIDRAVRHGGADAETRHTYLFPRGDALWRGTCAFDDASGVRREIAHAQERIRDPSALPTGPPPKPVKPLLVWLKCRARALLSDVHRSCDIVVQTLDRLHALVDVDRETGVEAGEGRHPPRHPAQRRAPQRRLRPGGCAGTRPCAHSARRANRASNLDVRPSLADRASALRSSPLRNAKRVRRNRRAALRARRCRGRTSHACLRRRPSVARFSRAYLRRSDRAPVERSRPSCSRSRPGKGECMFRRRHNPTPGRTSRLPRPRGATPLVTAMSRSSS